MVVAFTFVKLLTVTPVPDTVTPVAAPRLVPVIVTGTAEPRAPVFGETTVMVGASTVNAELRVALPLRFVTVTFLAPVPAVAEMVNVAVTVVLFTTWTLLTLTPRPDTVTIGVSPRPVPVIVTGTAVPRTPEFGETAVTVGFAMVNVTVLLVPPGVLTDTFLVPFDARRPIWNVAVTVVALTTVTPLTVIPVPRMPPPVTLTAEAPVRFVPVRVTWTVVDRKPVAGLIEVRVGAAAAAP
jgi:hypothetical protein